ncbi:lipase 3 [Drosophila eugracilis]|uniref:lipase 3 n=1 Tax=Drosophila eugracilis TaxID=29029 RepID=UPI0007E80CBE|nr:lipase 3 [Drosophila eugracilis]
MTLPLSEKFLFCIFFLAHLHVETYAFFNPYHMVIPPNVLEDADLDTFQLISKYGYPADNYTVETDDGYILGVHRIARPGAIPVLMVHGLLDCSATWVMLGPTKSLGYLVYEQGYDVWMANVRGNTYSKRHVRYTSDDPEFWDFSFHEMGVYDVPSIIDFVLMRTGFSQLYYIAHSQGTASFWIMASEKPQYMDKIILMQALAPVAYLTHCRSPVVNLLAAQDAALTFILRSTGYNEFFPSTTLINWLKRVGCHETTITNMFCESLFFIIFGFNYQQLNATLLPIVTGHTPAGASMKQLNHYGQLRNSRRFQLFDYGILNIFHYGSIFPPIYKLENVKAKVALYHANNDWLAPPEDVELLYEQLPNVVDKYLVPDEDFTHLDLIWGIDAKRLVWDRMLAVMKFYEPRSFSDFDNEDYNNFL